MVRIGCIAGLAALHAVLPADIGAQGVVPSAVAASASWRSTSPSLPHGRGRLAGILPADTVQARPPHAKMPYLVGGALLGAALGAMLASSYDCGEPQPGVYCSSTSPFVGAIAGAGAGLAFGWLLWALAEQPPSGSAPAGSGAARLGHGR